MAKNYSKDFGIVLKELRKESKVTQEGLAELTGLDPTYISLIERGLRNPTINTFMKIAEGLNIDPSILMKKLSNRLN